MRKIPVRNYIIALIISILTVLLVFRLMDLYNSKEVKLNFMNEVSEKDLDYYIAENNNVIVYMTDNKRTKEINKELKKYLKNKEINIIYVDLNEVSENFEKEFENKYFDKYYSSVFTISDTSIVEIKDGMIERKISKITDFDQIKEFIEGAKND